MARVRLINPGFFRHEELAELPLVARYTFIGLWTIADREGRLEDRPRRIKADLFPYEADPVDMEAVLSQLADAGFIQRYDLDGRRIIWIPKFLDHQKPHPRESKSVLAPPRPTRGEPKVNPRQDKDTPRRADSRTLGLSDSRTFGKDSCGQPPVDPLAEADQRKSFGLTPDTAPVEVEPETPPPQVEASTGATHPDAPPLRCKTGEAYRVTTSQVEAWAKAYPDVDVLAELRKAAVWLDANQPKRKTRSGMPRFVNGWLNNAKGGNGHRAQDSPPEQPPEPAFAFTPDFYDRQSAEFTARKQTNGTPQPRD